MSKLLRTAHFTFSAILSRPIPTTLPIHLSSFHPNSRRNFFIRRAFESAPEAKSDGVLVGKEEKTESGAELDDNGSLLAGKGDGEDYPSGEFEFQKPGGWKRFVVKLRMLIAFPWQRVRKGSVLTIKLGGQENSLCVMSLHVKRKSITLAVLVKSYMPPPSAYFTLYGFSVQASYLGVQMKQNSLPGLLRMHIHNFETRQLIQDQ